MAKHARRSCPHPSGPERRPMPPCSWTVHVTSNVLRFWTLQRQASIQHAEETWVWKDSLSSSQYGFRASRVSFLSLMAILFEDFVVAVAVV